MASKYEMKVGLNVVNHLGIHLYSNLPAVLSEAIANAYDADATRVDVTVGDDVITISDNGIGMTVEEINSRFLQIGYPRRELDEKGGSKSERLDRDVMGRKGIGKLSLFSIANDVEVRTRRRFLDDSLGESLGLHMSREDIQRSARRRKTVYEPDELDVADDEIATGHGTVIRLTNLEKKFTKGSVKSLRTRIARRFSVIGDTFEVAVDGDAIGPEDRDFYKFLQYAWAYDDDAEALLANEAPSAEVMRLTPGVESKDLLPALLKDDPDDDDLAGYELSETVSGWIGAARKPGQLTEDNNSVSILARGKLVHEDVLATIGTAEIYNSYLVGEVRADFVDSNEDDDVATSDRQHLKEGDPRVRLLLEKLKLDLREVGSNWNTSRRTARITAAQEKHQDHTVLGQLSVERAEYLSSVLDAIVEDVPQGDQEAAAEMEAAVVDVAQRRWTT